MLTDTKEFFEKALPAGLIIAVFLLGFIALSPFVPALLWSVFISVAVFPFYTRFCARIGGRRAVATMISALTLVVLILVPMVLLLRSVIALLPDLAIAIAEEGALDRFGVDLPADMSGTWSDLWNGIRDDLERLRGVVGDDLRLLLSSVMLEGRLIGHFILEFLLGLILAAMILHNAEHLQRLATKAAMKVGGQRGHDLAHRAVATIRYAVLGILGSAAVQAGVAALAYWFVGAPHWPLLAMATFLLGMLQVGPVLIWAPLSLWLWLEGQFGMAIFLALWGLFAVGLSDNVVKALVVSRGANLPAIMVFLGAVGGLLVWGIVGIFLGPIILALCHELTLWWLDEDRPAQQPDMQKTIETST
jgi:predicted PurR-regulated permease PerM